MLPIPPYHPHLHTTPFAVFRRLREGRPPVLVDVRPQPTARTLQGAIPSPGPAWVPPAGQDVVLFDEDGAAALERARRWQAAGHPRVRALYGGLALWDFALDPQVVGEETYLVGGGA